MSGIEVAGLIVSALHPCVEGFKRLSAFFKSMRHLCRSAAELECRVQKEQGRLLIWARIHNIVVDEFDRETPRQLHESLRLTVVANAVGQQLGLMKDNLDIVRTIAEKYAIETAASDGLRSPAA